MTESVSTLRTRYPVFHLLNPTWELNETALKITCHYQTGEHSFDHTLVFHDIPYDRVAELPQSAQVYLSRQIALVELFNYWKLTCSPEINTAWHMTTEEQGWWHNLLEHGMGEYFYQNQIAFSEPDFIKFTSEDGTTPEETQLFVDRDQPSYLIPVGGGKDSSVTLELIGAYAKKEGYRAATIMVNPNEASQATAKASPIDTHLAITRKLDPLLLKLNSQ